MALLSGRPFTLFTLIFLSLFATSSVHGSLLRRRDQLQNFHLPTERGSTPQVSPAHILLARQSSGDDGYQCGPDSPCTNGACCGESGWCGYGPDYCGDGCQSDCDATAECGQYAESADQECPLNVCCSQWGFCGTTTDFCGDGCQSNCDQPEPSGGGGNVQSRVIGYWETWNSQHPCGTMTPGQIPASLLTHLNVAFAYITADFAVTNMDGVSPDIYKNVGDVKSKNPNIKLVISIGGWSFSDPGATQAIFPTMVSTAANRATFIQNLLSWLSEYGYDGVDFDWEYPGADDRGGSTDDGVNYTAFLKELRAAIDASGKDYIVTFTAPTSYWYLRHFDLANMMNYVDWVNLMSYDLHGTWDATDVYIGNQVLAHTNITEIELALDLFWRVDVDPSMIVLGLGFYGRSFMLSDAACYTPGCAFSSAGEAGSCTETAGILSYREIMQILADTGATAFYDKDAQVKYLVYGDNSWVSYDDAETFAAKIDYANSKGLAGLMVWAIDLDDANHDALLAITDGASLDTSSTDFSLVPLEYLFPTEDLPSNDAAISYGLINFGSDAASSGSMNPSGSGFGFMLVAEDSATSTKLKQRDGNLTERDDGSFQIRVDFSNHPDYWDSVVDSPGIQSGGSDKVKKRYFAPEQTQWDSKMKDTTDTTDTSIKTHISVDMSAPLFWEQTGPSDCTVDGDHYAEGVAIYVDGTLDAEFYYGFSMISSNKNSVYNGKGVFAIDQSSAFIKVTGTTDLTFGVGGLGDIDISKAKKGNPAELEGSKVYLDGSTVDVYSGVYVQFKPYYQITYMVATFNGTTQTADSVAPFNGQLESRVISDLGSFTVTFPPEQDTTVSTPFQGDRDKNMISIPDSNVLYSSSGQGGQISVGAYLTLGVEAWLSYSSNGFGSYSQLADWQLTKAWTNSHKYAALYNTMTAFSFDPNGDEVCVDYEVSTTVYQYVGENTVNWDVGGDAGMLELANDLQTPDDNAVCYVENSDWNTKKRDLSESKDHRLESRISGGSGLLDWGFKPDTQLTVSNVIGDSEAKMFDNKNTKLGCDNCVTCSDKDGSYCCGCVCLRCAYGFSDIDDCPLCDEINVGGDWPGTVSSAKVKREHDYEDISENHHGALTSPLMSRAPGIATMSTKEVLVCNDVRFYVNSPYRYPAFPSNANNPWDGIENGKWDAIDRYYGNNTWACSDWTVGQLATADQVLYGGSYMRADYQTEHVLEGQLIGDFFKSWLAGGGVTNQPDSVILAPAQTVSCNLIEEYIQETDHIYFTDSDGKQVPFIELLLSELGNESHLDRLAILMARPNRMKGALFTGGRAIDPDKNSASGYKNMGPEAQLQAVKDFGMVFQYMNDDNIWSKFCSTFEAIYADMQTLDTWNAGSGHVFPVTFATEWSNFVRASLDSIVVRSRALYSALYSKRKSTNSVYEFHWTVNNVVNKSKFQIPGTCAHLSGTTV
ncbi:hypothetical protein BX600DRAFT_525229 [Xylariales sp. PMI_506]|nr:hypothetical protein BX600DRAFT_525229 [Xylariales sp. PMI_506]